MFSAEKPCIDRPRSRANHCNSAAERRQHYWNPRIADVCGGPQFDKSNQCPHDWGPQADKKKYSRKRADDLRNHEWRIRGPGKLKNPEANKQAGRKNALKQKTYTRPAVSKARKKSLQEFSPVTSYGRCNCTETAQSWTARSYFWGRSSLNCRPQLTSVLRSLGR